MKNKGDVVAMWLGGISGLLVSLYFLVYAPMASNYEQCGSVFLCAEAPQENHDG